MSLVPAFCVGCQSILERGNKTCHETGLKFLEIEFNLYLILQVFHGNRDKTTVVSHTLQNTIKSSKIRFWPLVKHNFVSMRTELYGCMGGKKRLPFYSQKSSVKSYFEMLDATNNASLYLLEYN